MSHPASSSGLHVRQPGRPRSPGEKTRIDAKVRVELKAAANKAAASMGMSLTEYLTHLVIRDTGLQFPEDTQEGLPFAEVA